VDFAGPQYFVGEGAEEGEASMDEETDEEEDYSDEDRVEMGRPSTSLGMRDEDAEVEEEETEDENDQSMEIEETVNLGRILPRQSLAGSSRQSLSDISDQGAALNVSTGNHQHQEQGDRSIDQSDMSMDTSIEGSSRGDNDDRTMDFTIPVGRVLPSIPPDNATKGSIPLGYSVPDSPNSQIDRIHPGEPTGDDMEMEETVAFGGIVEDDTVSSASSMDTDPLRERTATYSFGYGAGGIQPSVVATNDAEDGMDMTVATGGILAAGQSPALEDEEDGMEMTVATGGILGQTQSYPAVSPARLPTNTRPMSGTPSFARPTSSSLQRSQSVKRNVFAPSPASAKADRTPRKSGMATAGEVAKRLSFTSTTSSGGSGKKRPWERDENEDPTPGSGKKPRPSPATSIGEGVFGVPASSPVEATSSPRKSIVTSPRKSILPSARKSILPSPRRSLGPPSLVTPRKSVSTQASSAATPSNGGTPARSAKSPKSSTPGASSVDLVDADGPITLSEFLRMAQVQFADGQTVTKRRISVGRHGLAHPTGERVFGLEEYAEAQIQGVMHETYEWVSQGCCRGTKECG
jgi:kinetochore protein Spc7/SPC105